MGKSKIRRHFIFTDNESSNLTAAINLLKYDELTDNTIIYCAVRKTKFTTQLAEHYKGRLVIVDDSRIAVTALKKREVEHSSPIDYVTIDEDNAAVTSVFTAMVIGFGTTGQDALRFLYEFSALPDENGLLPSFPIPSFSAESAAVQEMYGTRNWLSEDAVAVSAQVILWCSLRKNKSMLLVSAQFRGILPFIDY